VQRFILNERIELRPLRQSDAGAYYDCARKNIRRLEPWFYWASDAMTLEETQNYLYRLKRSRSPRSTGRTGISTVKSAARRRISRAALCPSD
jgi:hypothetical protein